VAIDEQEQGSLRFLEISAPSAEQTPVHPQDGVQWRQLGIECVEVSHG
jgi:hypothetical protein